MFRFNRNSSYFHLLLITVGIFAVVLLSYFILWHWNKAPTDREVTSLGIGIGLVALVVTYWFAQRHTEQLTYLREISSKLETKTAIRQNISRILVLTNHPNIRYKCIFPVRYARKPLPLIQAGDFYALHLIQTLVDNADAIELKPINESAGPGDSELTDPSILEGNCIYLCTPLANKALDQVAPAINLDLKNRPNNSASFCDSIVLPAWFGVQTESNIHNNRDWQKKVIYYFGDPMPIFPVTTSPVDEEYKLADASEEGTHPEIHTIKQTDYGVLARLTLPNFRREGEKIIADLDSRERRKIVLIAGIHQYGTWIAGECFSKIALNEFNEYSEIFFGETDFMAVVRGDFETAKFKVTSCNIEHIWHSDGARWNLWSRPESAAS